MSDRSSNELTSLRESECEVTKLWLELDDESDESSESLSIGRSQFRWHRTNYQATNPINNGGATL
jgi:DNA-binding CsgD family transcriptional regulator